MSINHLDKDKASLFLQYLLKIILDIELIVNKFNAFFVSVFMLTPLFFSTVIILTDFRINASKNLIFFKII